MKLPLLTTETMSIKGKDLLDKIKNPELSYSEKQELRLKLEKLLDRSWKE